MREEQMASNVIVDQDFLEIPVTLMKVSTKGHRISRVFYCLLLFNVFNPYVLS